MRGLSFFYPTFVILLLGVSLLIIACGSDPETLTVYSGRSKILIEPILDKFLEATGIQTRVRYANSSSIAAIILEEGGNSPADVVFLQDPGSLGVLSEAGMLGQLPESLLSKVDKRFRAPDGDWLGVSGRVRTVVYNTSRINPTHDLPESVFGFADSKWRGRVGWAPTNTSFQSFVTAVRVHFGDKFARDWLVRMMENDPVSYPKNTAIVRAVAAGEVDVGLVNHYYVERFLEERGEDFGARNHYMANGDLGALILVAGAGILKTSEKKATAELFMNFLASSSTQDYFHRTTKEYPLVNINKRKENVIPLGEMGTLNLDLSSLADLEGTLRMLRDVEALP